MKTKFDVVKELLEKNPRWGRFRVAEETGFSPATCQNILFKLRNDIPQGMLPKPKPEPEKVETPDPKELLSLAARLLSKGPMTPKSFATALGIGLADIEDLITELSKGHNVAYTGDSVTLDKPAFGRMTIDLLGEGWRRFGLVSDTHLCCQEERLAELHLQYDLFEQEEISDVFHAGNIVDGYIPKINGTSAICTTPDDQIQYVVDNYPRRNGITTHFITGDDHEGWDIQRGFNFGHHLELIAREQGRDDLRYLGHVEADIEVRGTGGSAIVKIQHPGGGSSYARSYTGQKTIECVPLDSEILTRRGWKKHDELLLGEEVLGFNPETLLCEWTVVLKINRGEGPVVKYENDQFSVACTENHRWVQEVEQRAGPNPNSKVPKLYSRKYLEVAPIGHTRRRSRILQVAKAPSGPGIGEFSYGDWLHRKDAENLILKMTSGERRAFIEGLLQGDGCVAVTGTNWRQIVLSQNIGPVLDAFRLACLLEGIATTERKRPGGSFKPETTAHRAVTMSAKTKRMCGSRYLTKTPQGIQPVWCPTTGLGTWVMRQGTTLTITGNSFEGGEKPAILVQGHYHVSNYMQDRNVHVVSLPGFQDQTIFARKKRLRMEVGGAIMEFMQSPHDGTVTRFRIEYNRYFDRGYYKAFLRSDKKLLKGRLIFNKEKK